MEVAYGVGALVEWKVLSRIREIIKISKFNSVWSITERC